MPARARRWARTLSARWAGQPLRAQLLVLAALAAGVAAAFDNVSWSGMQRASAEHERRSEALRREVDALRLAAGRIEAQRRDAARAAEASRAELARLDAALREARARTVEAADVPERLAGLMPPGGPRAVGLSSAMPQPVEDADLYRHPIELRLEGDWGGLLSRVRAIESELPAIRWRGIELSTVEWPTIRGRLELYTLSGDGAWIRF